MINFVEIYTCFKEDLHINKDLPEVLPIPDRHSGNYASLGKVKPFTELFLGDEFFGKKVNNKYLIQILYHEYTHILDRITYLKNIEDEERRRNLLFPYNEFHACQIEMSKRLELFHNPQKDIRKSTMVCDESGYITLEEFLNKEIREYQLRYSLLKEDPNLDNVQKLIYLIIYNMGYYSICVEKGISEENLFINYDNLSTVKKSFDELKELLLKNEPSDELCIKTNKIANEITKRMLKEFNIKI